MDILYYCSKRDTQLSPQTTSVCSQPSCGDFRYNWRFTVKSGELYQQPSRHRDKSHQYWSTQEKWVAPWSGLVEAIDNEWPKKVNLEFASYDQNKQTAFITTTKAKDSIVQWEQISNFNPLVNTMAYVQRVFNKQRPQQNH